jgi:hypothetical protein
MAVHAGATEGSWQLTAFECAEADIPDTTRLQTLRRCTITRPPNGIEAARRGEKNGMLSYLLRRRRFSRSFEPSGDGYLYRRTPRAEAFYITSQEKAAFSSDFWKGYLKYHLILWVAFIALIFALIGIFVLVDAGEMVMRITIYLLVLGVLIGTFSIDRHLLNRPQSHLAGRMPVTSDRSWKDVRLERIAKASWSRFVISGAVLAGVAWFTFPRSGVAGWVPIAWVCYLALCFGLWGRNLWLKFKMARNAAI